MHAQGRDHPCCPIPLPDLPLLIPPPGPKRSRPSWAHCSRSLIRPLTSSSPTRRSQKSHPRPRSEYCVGVGCTGTHACLEGWVGALLGCRGAEAPAEGSRVGTVDLTWQAAHGTLLMTHRLGAGSESYVRAAQDVSGNTALWKPDFSRKLNLLLMRFHFHSIKVLPEA